MNLFKPRITLIYVANQKGETEDNLETNSILKDDGEDEDEAEDDSIEADAMIKIKKPTKGKKDEDKGKKDEDKGKKGSAKASKAPKGKGKGK